MARKLSKVEIEEWNNLYEYVRVHVLGYDANQSLSKQIVLRLKGLASGKFIENNKTKDMSHYSYKIILLTFKLCSAQIQSAIHSKDFRDENHKFNYILKIVENNINDVYLRLRNTERSEEKIKNIDTSVLCDNGADYVSSKTKPKNGLDALW